MWKKHFMAMEDEYHCMAPDLPGHGRSNNRQWTSVEQVGEEIAGIIGNSPAKKAHVVGLSLGGVLAMYLLARHPQLVDRAVVDGASATPIPGAFMLKLGVRFISPFLHSSKVIRAVASALKIDAAELENFTRDLQAVNRTSFARAFSQANSKLPFEGLEKIRNNVLFLAGELEAGVVASNERMAKVMAHAASVTVPGVNHGWLGQLPELHVQLTRLWIKGLPLPALSQKPRSVQAG
jgi:pimeloyl-ACP methyl ester carboxylesterase